MNSGMLKLRGHLKMLSLAMPFALIATGSIGLGTAINSTLAKEAQIRNDAKNTEIVQEIIENQSEKLQNSLKNESISSDEYLQKKNHLESNEFIGELINTLPELKDFKDANAKNYSNLLFSTLYAAPILAGTAWALAYYSSGFFGGKRRYHSVIQSAKNDYAEAKEIEKKNKMNNEYNNYKE